MFDTPVYIWLLLEFETFNDRPLLIKLVRIDKTLKLEFFELLLYLTKWKLDSVVLRTIRDIENPLHTQLFHLLLNGSSFVSR